MQEHCVMQEMLLTFVVRLPSRSLIFVWYYRGGARVGRGTYEPLQVIPSGEDTPDQIDQYIYI